jgi:putative ABC transport system permease protein
MARSSTTSGSDPMTARTESLACSDRARLPAHELLAVALQGLPARRLRAALSALGIAIGIGAMVAVVGVSSSAQANLIAEIDRLGTNLLTVSPGQDFLGNNPVLPDTAGPMIDHMRHVRSRAAVFRVGSANVYRTKYVPAGQTGGIGVDATDDNLPQVVATSIASGRFLDAVSSKYPEGVLGSQAAATLQTTNTNHSSSLPTP